MRVIFVPQYPTHMRYQDWWIDEFQDEFLRHFKEIVVLGNRYVTTIKWAHSHGDQVLGDKFSPTNSAIQFECKQVIEYMEMDLRPDDILFVADLSFPGFFTSALFHKKPKYCFGYVHATSLNSYDYFESVRSQKWKVEKGHIEMFNEVFVGSKYHQQKLMDKGIWNAEVLRVPYPPFRPFCHGFIFKKHKIISVARPGIQKVNKKVEKAVENSFGKIVKASEFNFTTWEQYYKFVGESQIMLITGKEETFGYQVIDAIHNNCIPLAPNKYSYPELLPRFYLYDSVDELLDKIGSIIQNGLGNRVLDLNRDVKISCVNFYDELVKRMFGYINNEIE